MPSNYEIMRLAEQAYPKVNKGLAVSEALAALLVSKGIFTEAEYYKALADSIISRGKNG